MRNPWIAITFDGDTHWLACFGDKPDSEIGDAIVQVEAGTTWDDLCNAVAEHERQHGCQHGGRRR